MERRRVRYLGRVQGVGFRATCRHLARSFTVSGWVRNEPDGSVVLEAQGEAGELDRFEGAIRDAMGRNIQAAEGELLAPLPDERGFEIRR
ncbi:MAG: acylphosphatase [Phycisphaerales bacterium JB059]